MINYSFIIPHKNCPELLKRCVDSIPMRADVQIIVIDDNSEEDKKPFQKREGLEIVYLNDVQPKGAGHARNVGLGKAKGRWLLFPDSDDYYKEGFLEVLDQYATQDVDVVYFNFEYRDGTTGVLLKPLYFNKDFDDYNGSKEAKERIKFHHNVPWTKMVRNEYVQKYQFCFEEAINGNDIYFTMQLGFNTNNILVEKAQLYAYLRNPNSLVTQKPTALAAFCKFRHSIELNRFYEIINHPEWKKSILFLLLSYTKLVGLNFVFFTFKKSLTIHRNSLIKVVQKNELSDI